MIRKKLDELLARQSAAAATLNRVRQEGIVAKSQLADAELAQGVLQDVAELVQQSAHTRIASVVTRCIEAIFDEPYDFRIIFEQKRGKTEARLAFAQGEMVLDDPLAEIGGGTIDVASFALRLVCLILERPPQRRVLVLDEPFTKIRGAQNRQRMRELVQTLADEFDIQIIINIDTDSYPEFMLGKVIEFG